MQHPANFKGCDTIRVLYFCPMNEKRIVGEESFKIYLGFPIVGEYVEYQYALPQNFRLRNVKEALEEFKLFGKRLMHECKNKDVFIKELDESVKLFLMYIKNILLPNEAFLFKTSYFKFLCDIYKKYVIGEDEIEDGKFTIILYALLIYEATSEEI